MGIFIRDYGGYWSEWEWEWESGSAVAFVRSFVRSFVCSLCRSFVRLFLRSFVVEVGELKLTGLTRVESLRRE